MAFDYKKEYKEFYMPKNRPEIIDIPVMNYIEYGAKVIQMKKTVRINRQ